MWLLSAGQRVKPSSILGLGGEMCACLDRASVGESGEFSVRRRDEEEKEGKRGSGVLGN